MTSGTQRQASFYQRSRGTSSSISNSGSSDNYSISSSEKTQSRDEIIFDTKLADPFHQLLDDLNIIDDFIPDYNDLENEIEWHYERQVADAARNVAQKQSTVFRLCQFEQEQFMDLNNFLTCYLEPLIRWMYEPNNTVIFQRFPDVCSTESILELYEIIRVLAKAHQDFFQGIKERLSIWGPTQFLSDLFSNFYDKSILYNNYLSIFPKLIHTIDTLYKKSITFAAFIDNCMSQSRIRDIKDVLFYFKNPLLQLPNYLNFISSISEVTDPMHPDYKPLIALQEKFSNRESHWKSIVKDRLAHIRVLEASRSIQDNPATVSDSRRLLISGLLVRVDISNPQSTADLRTYLLYNDLFIFTQKLKSNLVKNNQTEKLCYKGSISLKHAEVLPLSSKTMSKVSETKKSASRSFMRNRSEIKETNKPAPIYGFELNVNDIVAESQTRIDNRYANVGSFGLYTTVPGESTMNSSKKVFIMRTQNEAEQNAWMHLISRVIKDLSRNK